MENTFTTEFATASVLASAGTGGVADAPVGAALESAAAARKAANAVAKLTVSNRIVAVWRQNEFRFMQAKDNANRPGKPSRFSDIALLGNKMTEK